MSFFRSMMSSFLTGCVIIATLIFSGATLAVATQKTNAGNDTLRIIYSGGLTGNIEPCG